MTTPLPTGFRIQPDPDTKNLGANCLFGGSPARIMRLTPSGQKAWQELRSGPVGSTAAGLLARRLTDAGLAHPRPPQPDGPTDVTVVIPVRDRPEMLQRCLVALGSGHCVVVVDDASRDAARISQVVAQHGVTLIRREVHGGPASARNTGLAGVRSEFVAFLDSDCIPAEGWIERLAGHFADPLVGAVAPRVTARSPHTWAGRYTRSNGSLDLGAREAQVRPAGRVPYVPTAALLARRAALTEIARSGRVFDPALQVGEDVDMIWRMHEAGWRIRYDPAVQVAHQEPRTWAMLLARRFRYGTSAAPLGVRHPAATMPLVLHPWPALAVAGLLGRRPALALAAYAASVATMTRTLRRAGIPRRGVAAAMLAAAWHTWLGIGRFTTQFAAPAVVTVVVRGGSAPGRTGRRLAAASLLFGPPVATWLSRRPDLDLPRYVLGQLADDIAYGAGVWTGCARVRSLTAVRPMVSLRPLHITTPVPRLA